MTMLIDLIAGARPNFMKVAPILEALEKRMALGAPFSYRLIHTGQHYDRSMSAAFFEQLGLPEPHVHFGAGSGTPAEQTARIMVAYESLLNSHRSDLCLVVGDVTSTMACAITAKKAGVAVAHVEAGIRSGDRSMPEEINRIVTDSVADLFFTTSETASRHLLAAGTLADRIHFVGNTMIDTLLKQRPRFTPPACWHELQLQPDAYLVLTLHRPANVDGADALTALLASVTRSSGSLPIVFPVHPRTRAALNHSPFAAPNLHLVDPLGYLEFNFLVSHARGVITDSGGITEETTVLGIPCLTLRNSTERPETITMGTNELVGTNPAALPGFMDRLLSGRWKQGQIPPLWDGHTGERIVAHLENWAASQSASPQASPHE